MYRARGASTVGAHSRKEIPVNAKDLSHGNVATRNGRDRAAYVGTYVEDCFMRQYLAAALPDELLDAAKVDGATALRTVWSVVLPIARPGMAVLGMLTFMTAWNDFFWPVIALDTTNPTLQVALAALGGGYVPDTGVIMAGTLVGTLPVVVVFLLLGRQIVGGIVAGAVKA